ncbi:hypothetical protein ACGF0D_40140 [Kitasatospora sp. NPDC048298]|uniref:hypothetical protein n=1 Tax=Kitasatospora sp. NPDC048298 TaxID=3364049 RepID=UPI0037155CE7
MDAELLTLANTAGTTLVTLLATDAWTRAKSSVGSLWRRARPEAVEVIEADLVETREELLAARAAGDDTVEGELVADWQRRLRRLLAADPGLGAELRRLLQEELVPAPPAASQTWTGSVTMSSTVSGRGKNFQIGQGTLNISES